MALSPYLKPTVPFIGPISGGLKDGMAVLVTGSVSKSCRRFRVDFQCGNCKVPKSDVAFHFNVRFDQNCIICNSHENGDWQDEERKDNMVFCKGHPFEIQFLVNISSYVVLVDGNLYLEFKHRIPFSRVEYIGISGELDVDSISFQDQITDPVCSKPICPISLQPIVYPIGECFQPPMFPIPYRASIYGGFSPSKSIIVSGSVPPCAHRFYISLKAGNDTAFLLNPRFDENVIVRNCRLNMRWGSAEQYLPRRMPLLRGQPFIIWIQCEPWCFKVAVNGHHQFDYQHRISNLLIDLLEVDGDITLINIIKSPDWSYW